MSNYFNPSEPLPPPTDDEDDRVYSGLLEDE